MIEKQHNRGHANAKEHFCRMNFELHAIGMQIHITHHCWCCLNPHAPSADAEVIQMAAAVANGCG